MRAIVINGKEDLTLAELPVPEPGPGQVRIRTAYVGICGSDLHYYYEGANGAFVIREPLVPGHEMSGTVDARSEEHTSELQSRGQLVCRLLLENKNNTSTTMYKR